MISVDLNSDIGEGFGRYEFGTDESIVHEVTSVNIACGFHAGDPVIMSKTVKLAMKYSRSIGAHPSFPDLMGFGRREMVLSDEEIRDYMIYQLGSLHAFLRCNGGKMTHVKPHGALYNMATYDSKIANSIVQAIHDFDRTLIVVGLFGSELIEASKKKGLRFANEVFADRAYNDDGTLVSRKIDGAVLEDIDEIVKRAVSMVKDGIVKSVNGKEIKVKADTICVHSDTPNAPEMAKNLREALLKAGLEVKRLI
jgi:UPF0271 protein